MPGFRLLINSELYSCGVHAAFLFLCTFLRFEREVDMARICPLFSGSTGNSTYITASGTGLLIDAGASFRSLTAALAAVGGSPEDISAVAVTHEHTDHIKGLKMLLKTLKIPLIASEKTLETLSRLNVIPPETVLISAEDNAVSVGSLELRRFSTSHDCPGSGGYTVTLPDGSRAAVCTDLGVMTDTVREGIYGCKAVLLESNHDVTMLKNGPYPPQLKLRILSDKGHLSNAACASELPALVENGTTRIILGHLSQKNNLPMLALSASKAALADRGITVGEDCLLSVASPSGNGVTVI